MTEEYSVGVTDQELQRARQWFRSKGVRLKCPVCGSGGSFHLLRPVLAPMLDDTRSEVISNTGLTLLPALCEHCAYVMFFNADMTNIFWKSD